MILSKQASVALTKYTLIYDIYRHSKGLSRISSAVVFQNPVQISKRIRQIFLLGFLVTASFDSSAQSNRFEAGIAAMNRGRFAVAYRSWLPLAEAGMPEAQLNLGLLYQSGQGVDIDVEKAFYWYEKAASAGLAEAHLNLGMMYFEGLNVEQDYTISFQEFQSASMQGLSRGSFMLGKMLFEGLGVEQDMRRARELFLDAAKSGLPEAQFSYAVVAQTGDGLIPEKRLFFLPEKKDLGDPLVAYVWGKLAYLNGHQTEDTVQLYEVAEIMLGDRFDGIDRIISRCLETDYEDCPTK